MIKERDNVDIHTWLSRCDSCNNLIPYMFLLTAKWKGTSYGKLCANCYHEKDAKLLFN